MSLVIDNIDVEMVLSANGLSLGEINRTLSGTPLQLVNADRLLQRFNAGSITQTVKLPDATTINLGRVFYIFNDTDEKIIIQDFDGTELTVLNKNGRSQLYLVENGGTAGVWDKLISSSSALSGSSHTLAQYGGQANTGRVLNIFSGIDSEDAPFVVIGDSVIIGITLNVGASATVTVGIFEASDMVNPVATISIVADVEIVDDTLNIPVAALSKLSARVTSGSCQKPTVAFYLSAV